MIERKPQAFDLTNLLLAKTRMPHECWREYVDTQAKYFTREYILEENITKYRYNLKKDQSGSVIGILDPVSGEDILETFKRGVELAPSQALRERAQAEFEGFSEKIYKPILSKGHERFFTWISEPGRREDGFFDHSFTFIGEVTGESLEMVAFKNWIGAKRNREFLGLDKNSTAVDLLKNPIFLSSDLNSYRDVIRSLDPSRGDLSPDNNMWFLQALEPFREDIINSLEVNNLYGAQIARRVHNNYALALLRGDDQGILEKTYWESQPEVLLSGSCGFSGGESVASTYSGIEGKYFNCPRCERKLPYGRGIVVCIYCGLYKGNYQKETGQKCV